MGEKKITLSAKEEMLKRLLSVNSNSFIQEKFYPILLESAKKEFCAKGIALMFSLATDECGKGMPSMISTLIYKQVDRFIDVLVDDEEIATEAKNLINSVLDSVNT